MKRLLFGFSVLLMSIGFSGCGGNIDTVKDGVMKFNKTLTVGQALDNWQNCKSSKWEEFESSNGINIVQFTCIENNTIDNIKNVIDEMATKNITDKDIRNLEVKYNFNVNNKFNTNLSDITSYLDKYFKKLKNIDYIDYPDDYNFHGQLNDLLKKVNLYNKKLEELKNGKSLQVSTIQDIFQFTINKDDSFQVNNVQYEIVWKDGKKLATPINSIGRLRFAYQNGIDNSFIFNNQNEALRMSKSIYNMYSRAK